MEEEVSKSGAKVDSINPPYYKGDVVMYVIEHFELDFLSGTIVKYLLRAGKKNGCPEIEDLKKAQWYLNRKINNLERGTREETE